MRSSPDVGEHMARYPFIADKSMGASKAFEYMRSCGIRHLPVIENDRIVGLVSDRDLRQVLGADGSSHTLVQEVMVKDPFTVEKGTPLSQVAQIMADKKYGCTLVADENGFVIGIFTTTDGMRLLSELLRRAPELSQSPVGIEHYSYPLELAVI